MGSLGWEMYMSLPLFDLHTPFTWKLSNFPSWLSSDHKPLGPCKVSWLWVYMFFALQPPPQCLSRENLMPSVRTHLLASLPSIQPFICYCQKLPRAPTDPLPCPSSHDCENEDVTALWKDGFLLRKTFTSHMWCLFLCFFNQEPQHASGLLPRFPGLTNSIVVRKWTLESSGTMFLAD